jgi:hypothetical protein
MRVCVSCVACVVFGVFGRRYVDSGADHIPTMMNIHEQLDQGIECVFGQVGLFRSSGTRNYFVCT